MHKKTQYKGQFTKPKNKLQKGEGKNIMKDYEKIKYFASRGLTNQQIAAALGVSYPVYCRYKRVDVKVKNAYIRGRNLGIGKVASCLFEAATIKKNVAAMTFYLKCQGGWKEKVNQDKNNENQSPNYVVVNIPDNGRRQTEKDSEQA